MIGTSGRQRWGQRLRDLWATLRFNGMRWSFKVLRARLWSDSFTMVFASDLARLPRRREARVPVVLVEEPSRTFEGFRQAMATAAGSERADLVLRQNFCAAGLETLSVARTPEGLPMFATWNLGCRLQPAMPDGVSAILNLLRPGDTALEGVYTFPEYRRLGVHLDGTLQQLERVRDAGFKRAVVVVHPANEPSLRALPGLGFDLDQIVRLHFRFGRRTVSAHPPDEIALGIWAAAKDRKGRAESAA